MSPKSIYTGPNDFLPIAQQQPAKPEPPLRSYSAGFTQFPLPLPQTQEAPPILRHGGSEGRGRYTLSAWAHPRVPDPLFAPPGQDTGRGDGGGDSTTTGIVPTLGQLAAGKKRRANLLADSSSSSSSITSGEQQKPFKRPRLQEGFKLDQLAFARLQGPSYAPQGQPPSPLFFSHSTSTHRPQLPPRFSSGEAGDRMLRQADAEEGKVKTVKLARAAYSGSSPTSVGLSSFRSTPSSTLPDAGSPDVGSLNGNGNQPHIPNGRASAVRNTDTEQYDDGTVDPSRLIHDVGITELLELDLRPTLIVDLGEPSNYAPGPLVVLFANSSLRSNLALFEAVKGRASAISPRADPTRAYSGFKSWILSAAVNGESLDVCLPGFVHAGVSWSCSTLRKRLRVACASAAMLTSSHSSTSPHVSSLTARTPREALPTSSSGSLRRRREEPSDYFGNAIPENVQTTTPEITRAQPLPWTKPETPVEGLPSIELQGATTSDYSEHSAEHQVVPSVEEFRRITDLSTLDSHPSLTNECVLSAHVAAGSVDGFGSTHQEDIGFFDWTRLPYSDNLPRHIKFARSIDWSQTGLGPIELWPADLRQMCNLIMASPHPAAMYWGEDLVAIYNEAYILLAGQKHPKLMGQAYRDAWAEIWDEVKDVFANARQTGQATMKDDDCLFIKRSNFLEETYFSWSIIPMVGGDGTVTGLYNPAFEKTRRKIVERRMLTLREVGERTATARDVKGFWTAVNEALAINDMDTPFVMLYSVSEEHDSDSSSVHSSSILGTKQCYLEGSLGVPEGHPVAPEQLELKTGMEGFGPVFREVMKTDKPVLLRVAGTEEEEPIMGCEFDGQSLTHEIVIEKGPEIPAALLEGIHWRGFGDPCRSVVICPVHPTTGDSILGFLVLGVNPRRPYDDDYALFIQLLSRQLATSLASVVLFEEEIRRGQRAAKLAALDRIELSEQLAARTQEARDSETRFARMAELSPAALFIANSQGQIIYCNDTWYEITRVSKDSTSTHRWIDAVSQDDQPKVRHLWAELVDDCKPFTAEFRFKAQWYDRDGKPSDTWVLFSAFPETYSDALSGVSQGKLKSVFGSLTDISQQKWAEDFQKRRREEAVELKRQQENFIDITSHEMRNPLSAILQCADEIKTRLGEFKEAKQKEMEPELLNDSIEAAETIMFCAQHQKQIVDDVLTLSKLDSHMLMVTPIDVQPITVVERALKMHENEIRNADIQMHFQVDDSYKQLDIDWVRLDPQRVLQVLINLTGNAIKFTSGRDARTITVTLAASLEKPAGHSKRVDYFPTRKRDDQLASSMRGKDWGHGQDVYIQFAVQDTGRGLDPEEKKMLFMRFSQASPRTHIQYGGSGLGLFISRELTELQGGEIGVASEAGKGSIFAFYVRARRSEKPANTEEQFPALVKAITAETKAKRSGSLKVKDANHRRGGSLEPKARPISRDKIAVLIVEDNLVNQKVLEKQLKYKGFNVSVANHGGEALEKLRESHFHAQSNGQGTPLSVVLMDQEMPVMDGLEATKKIREWERDGSLVRHVPIIGVTANARAEQIQTLLVAGMDDVVSKPFSILEIVPKIEEWCEKFGTIADEAVVSSQGSK